MKKIKLFKLIEIFDETQIKNFKLFLSSPYLNKGRNLKSFFNKLIKNYPDFVKIYEDYERILNTAKSPQVVRNNVSHITELALDFLGFENIRNNETLLNPEIGKTLFTFNSMGLIIDRIYKLEETAFNKKTDVIDYYYLFKLNALKGNYYFEKNNMKDLFEAQINSISYLIAYFMLELTKKVEDCKVININYNYNSPLLYEVNKLINGDVLDSIINQSVLKNKDFLMFFKEFHNPFNTSKYKETDYNQFSHILDIFERVFDTLGPLLKINISNALWNYWFFVQKNTGKPDHKISFKIIDMFLLKTYDEKVNSNLPIHIGQFTTYVEIAILNNNLVWASKFIDKYKHKLPEKHMNDVVNYSNGLILFHKKEFSESLKLFMNIESPVEIIRYELRIKVLQLHYELNYLDNLPVMIKSLKRFLKESEEQFSYLIEGYNLFLNNFNNLVRLKNNKDKFETEFKRKKLLKDTKTNEQQWLIEKYDELLNL